MNVLVAAASRNGATAEIGDAIVRTLRARGHRMFAGRLVGEHASFAQRVSLHVFSDLEPSIRTAGETPSVAGSG